MNLQWHYVGLFINLLYSNCGFWNFNNLSDCFDLFLPMVTLWTNRIFINPFHLNFNILQMLENFPSDFLRVAFIELSYHFICSLILLFLVEPNTNMTLLITSLKTIEKLQYTFYYCKICSAPQTKLCSF